jgi:hypothetical protein
MNMEKKICPGKVLEFEPENLIAAHMSSDKKLVYSLLIVLSTN